MSQGTVNSTGSVLRANLRSSWKRLIAAGITIAISVAFIVGGLLLVDSFNRGMVQQAEAEAAGVDLIIDTQQLAPEDTRFADEIAGLDGVTAAEEVQQLWLEYDAAQGPSGLLTAQTITESTPFDLVEGRGPATGASEAVITVEAADAYGLSIGDKLTTEEPWLDHEESEDDAEGSDEQPAEYSVIGIIDAAGGPRAYLSEAGMEASPVPPMPVHIRVVLEDHGNASAQLAAQEAITEELQGLIGSGGIEVPPHVDQGSITETGEFGEVYIGGMSVFTHQQIVDEWTEDLTGQSDFLTYIALGFGAIAVFVSALVITNTFQVIIASRQRTMALLRALGAEAAQLRRATLAEGAVLGGIAGLIGVLVGFVCALGFSLVAHYTFAPDMPIVRPTLIAAATGLSLGLVITLIGSLLPAVKAGRASPMAALRPADVEPPQSRISWLRLITGAVLTAGGMGLTLAAALATEPPESAETPGTSVSLLGLPVPLVGAAGALLGFLGVMLLARLIMPPIVGALGRLLALIPSLRTMAKLAGQNARQVPGRTAATASALLVGVTLVSSFTIGAATAQKLMSDELAESYPVDAVVGLEAAEVENMLSDGDITSVDTVVGAPGAQAEVAAETEDHDVAPEIHLVAAGEQELSQAAYRDDLVPEPGTALVGWNALTHTHSSGDTLQLSLDVGGEELQVDAEEAWWLPGDLVLVSQETAEGLALTEDQGASFLRLVEDFTESDAMNLGAELDAAMVDAGADDATEVDFNGAYMRASYTQIIDMVLLAVIALLGASVVVALIGVSNTLSLSVFERRREAALLRAVGMSRRSVGSMISIESVLLGCVALLLGTAIGAFFGWAGVSSLVLRDDWTVSLELPWGRLALIWAITLGAALLAAWGPARRLSKVQPAAGLAA